MKNQKRIAYYSADHANMTARVRAALELDLQQHYFTPRYQCTPFDPAELMELARVQYPQEPELAEALGRCTEQWRESALYTWFRDPAESGFELCGRRSLRLFSPTLGELVLDMIQDGRMIGVEFMDEVMRADDEYGQGVPKSELPALRIVHWR